MEENSILTLLIICKNSSKIISKFSNYCEARYYSYLQRFHRHPINALFASRQTAPPTATALFLSTATPLFVLLIALLCTTMPGSPTIMRRTSSIAVMRRCVNRPSTLYNRSVKWISSMRNQAKSTIRLINSLIRHTPLFQSFCRFRRHRSRRVSRSIPSNACTSPSAEKTVSTHTASVYS